MKKSLSLIIAVAFIAIISGFNTSPVLISKNLTTDPPPVIIFPPCKVELTGSITSKLQSTDLKVKTIFITVDPQS